MEAYMTILQVPLGKTFKWATSLYGPYELASLQRDNPGSSVVKCSWGTGITTLEKLAGKEGRHLPELLKLQMEII
jgi:hypothetical protein